MTERLHIVNKDLPILPKMPEELNLLGKNVVLCEVGREFVGNI